MISSNAYMQALRMRLFREDVRRSAAFGQIIGTAAGLYGWFGYFIGETHSDGFYLTFCFGGALILLAGIVCPLCLAGPAALFQRVMGKFGHLVFSALLACIYLVLLTPLARLTHAGSDVPAVRWEDGAGRICGWQPKRTRTLVQDGANGRGLTATLVQVLQHFARHGQWFLLPLLILLLSLGVLLFFAQTSVIAPFIYTLF